MARAAVPHFDDDNDTWYSDIFSPSNRQASPPSPPGVRAEASDSSITQYDGNSAESGPQFAAVIRPPAGERVWARRNKISTVSSPGGGKPLSESLRRAMEDDDHDSDQKLWSRDASHRDSGSTRMSAGSIGFSGGGRGSGGLGSAEEGFRRRRWQQGLVEETEGAGQKSGDSEHEFRVVRSSGSDFSVAEAVSPKAWDGEATGFGGFQSTVATPWRGLGGSGDHSPSNSKPRHAADAVGDLNVNPEESMLAQFKKQSPMARDPTTPIIGSKLLAAMYAEDEDKERGGITDSRYRSGNRAGLRDGGGWETGGSSSDRGGRGGDTPSLGGGVGGSNESQISEISEASEPIGGRSVRKPKSAIPAVAVVMPEFKNSSQGSYTQIFAQKTDEATKKKAKKSANPQGSELRPYPSKDAGSLLLASSIRRALTEELEDETAFPEATAHLRDRGGEGGRGKAVAQQAMGGGREEGGGGAGVIGLGESVGGFSEDEVEDEEERGEEAGGGKGEGGGVGGSKEHKGGGYSHPFATRTAYRRGVGGAEKVTPVPPMPVTQAAMAVPLPRPAVNMSSNESSPGSSRHLSPAAGAVGGERRRVPQSVSEEVGGRAGGGPGSGGGSIPVFEDMGKNNGKGRGGGGGFTEAFDHIQKAKEDHVPLPSMQELSLGDSLPPPKMREARGIRKLFYSFKRSFTLNS